jgi:DNA-directed RNA polymerase alpha subunit
MNTKELVYEVLMELGTGLDDASRSGCSIPAFNCRIEFSLAGGMDAVKFTVPFHFQGSKKIWNEMMGELRGELHEEAREINITPRTPVKDCGFDTRVLNALKRSKINTISDLVKQSYTDLLQIRDMGHGSIGGVKRFLNDHGLHLREAEEE